MCVHFCSVQSYHDHTQHVLCEAEALASAEAGSAVRAGVSGQRGQRMEA